MKARALLRFLCVSVGVLSLCVPAVADDWPQWRGLERNNASKEKGLLQSWPKNGPALLWTYTNAGAGYSTPAIVGDKVFSMGARGDTEYVFCVTLKDGAELWSARVAPTFTWKGNTWGDGPRATPTVDGELVYALGGQGELVCVEAATGKERWRKSMPADLGGEINNVGGSPEKIGWGYTWSPLVDGEQLICVPGGPRGAIAALNKKTGDVIWRSRDFTDQTTYASPIIAEVGGIRHYVQMTMEGAAGIAAKDGQLLWYYKRKPAYSDVLIPTPIFHDNCVYTTAGYGGGKSVGSDLIKLTAAGLAIKAQKVYSIQGILNRYGGVVLVGDHVYGYSEKNKEGEGWTCQDFKTGKTVWSEKRALGRGSLVYADGHLYCYTEDDGIVALVEASPAGWKEKSRFEIPRKTAIGKPNGKIWTHPVIANGKLFLRDQELIFCFDLKNRVVGNRDAGTGGLPKNPSFSGN